MIEMVVVGHIDHGKSSLIGRLLVETGKIKEDVYQRIRRKFKDDLNYALFLDSLKEEQVGGITIDSTKIRFTYNDKSYTIVDVPGHEEFMKNMVTGACFANVAVVVVDATEGFRKQTYNHMKVLSVLGIENIVIVINKMDLVNYSQTIFNKKKKELLVVASSLGFTVHGVVPVSSKYGDNICCKSANTPWYDGPTFLDCFDINYEFEECCQTSSRFVVQGLYDGYALGKVVCGSFEKLDKVFVYPGKETTVIKEIQKWPDENLFTAQCGSSICMKFEHDIARRGSIIVRCCDTQPNVTCSFKATVFWIADTSLNKGDKLIAKIMTYEFPVYVSQIYNDLNTEVRKFDDKELLESLSKNYFCVVKFISQNSIIIDYHKEIPELGRFVLTKNNIICGGGIII